jgi:hypothetical protein
MARIGEVDYAEVPSGAGEGGVGGQELLPGVLGR